MSKKLITRVTLWSAGTIGLIAAAAQLAKTGALGPTVIAVLLTALYWAPSIVAASRELQGPMLGAQRRVEGRIGQILGPETEGGRGKTLGHVRGFYAGKLDSDQRRDPPRP